MLTVESADVTYLYEDDSNKLKCIFCLECFSKILLNWSNTFFVLRIFGTKDTTNTLRHHTHRLPGDYSTELATELASVEVQTRYP